MGEGLRTHPLDVVRFDTGGAFTRPDHMDEERVHLPVETMEEFEQLISAGGTR